MFFMNLQVFLKMDTVMQILSMVNIHFCPVLIMVLVMGSSNMLVPKSEDVGLLCTQCTGYFASLGRDLSASNY